MLPIVSCAGTHSHSCNTEKDKDHIKNATTAGVLAVSWSCGVVIGVSELFGSESLTQVYAQLIKVWSDIDYVPPFFFYDNACHLAK